MGLLGDHWSRQSPLFTIRPRVFVSYHHSGDQHYYNVFSHVCHGYRIIYDHSLRNNAIDSENADYIRQQLRERYIRDTSCTIVLVGRNTWGRRFVDWEIAATLDKYHGLIGIQLPTAQITLLGGLRMPERLRENLHSGYASMFSWEELMRAPALLAQWVSTAAVRNKFLIKNGAELRKASSPLWPRNLFAR